MSLPVELLPTEAVAFASSSSGGGPGVRVLAVLIQARGGRKGGCIVKRYGVEWSAVLSYVDVQVPLTAGASCKIRAESASPQLAPVALLKAPSSLWTCASSAASYHQCCTRCCSASSRIQCTRFAYPQSPSFSISLVLLFPPIMRLPCHRY